MTVASGARFELPEQQAAFTGLLTHPLVTAHAQGELYALVTRHQHILGVWASRLGYRIVSVGSAIRLRRVPLGGSVAVPDGPVPGRRDQILALVAAACLEDHSGEAITLQEVSDATYELSSAGGIGDYHPDRRADRLALVRAVDLLVRHGVLRRRTERDDLLRAWEDNGLGVGAGYLLDRDALLVLVDPADSAAALSGPEPSADGDGDTRGPRILRALVETQSLVIADLDPADAEYLTGQRARLVARAVEMTGATAEIRRECILLVFPSEGRYAADATIGFPAVTTLSWVCLLLLDATIAVATEHPQRPGHRACPAAAVDKIVARVHADTGSRLTIALRESPAAIRGAAEAELAAAGLLVVEPDGAWLLRPAAARYRSADLSMGSPASPGPGSPGSPDEGPQDSPLTRTGPPAAQSSLFQDLP